MADDRIRERVLAFFRSLPLALERPGLRVVHASWDTRMVDLVRRATDVVELYEDHRQQINEDHCNPRGAYHDQRHRPH